MLDNTELPLVLIGGTLCTARLWQPLVEQLALSSVICISLTGSDSAPQAAQRLLQNLPPRFLLAGFSLGAIVALQMAADASERLGGLALISVNPLADAPENASSRRDAVSAAREQGLTGWLSANLWQKYVAPDRLSDSALKEIIGQMAQDSGHDTFASQTEIAITRRDNRDALAALTCPIIIINGAHDPICTPHHHQLASASAVHARRIAVRSAGHFVVLEAANEIALPLRQWIQESLNATQ